MGMDGIFMRGMPRRGKLCWFTGSIDTHPRAEEKTEIYGKVLAQ